ncbi:MAG: hypothetical protein JWQ38_92 [Flavipsychrobacter sp.]|nr:hypothetical protein [Flavipsychrobacter sp.]
MSHTFSFMLLCMYMSSPQITTAERLNKQVDSIVIIKHDRVMKLYSRQQLVRTLHVCLGPNPVGPKHFRNDGKTPEGIYYVNGKNPNSQYHKCLGVSYPSPSDIQYARLAGKPTGGDIKIHGLPNGDGHRAKEYTKQDWTLGCIALTDDEIDELYAHTNVGTYINILP